MPERFMLDANVLYSARLRDLFLQLHRNGAAYVYWTQRIENEWTAALAAGAAIITLNLAHFPSAALDVHRLTSISPDEALERLANEDPDRVLQSVRDIRRRLVNPPLSPSKYADGFEPAGCPGFASGLRERRSEF